MTEHNSERREIAKFRALLPQYQSILDRAFERRSFRSLLCPPLEALPYKKPVFSDADIEGFLSRAFPLVDPTRRSYIPPIIPQDKA